MRPRDGASKNWRGWTGLRAARARSSLCGNEVRTVRRGDDVPAGWWLLVRGVTARCAAQRCEGMPLSGLPAGKDCGSPESGQEKRNVKPQSIWIEGPPAVPATSARRAVTACATAYKLFAPAAFSPSAATGLPVSPPIRMRGSISISPSTGTP
jgi:hypothetical protein